MPDPSTEVPLKLLELTFARADALNGFWNLYIAVSLGMLGVMASGKAFTESKAIKTLLTLAFVAFAASNCYAIVVTNEQRLALLSLLVNSNYMAAATHSAPPSACELVAYHVILDLMVILAIWLVPWYRPGSKVSDPNAAN